MNVIDLPFNRHIGLTSVQRGGHDVLCLVTQAQHLNHLGTVHASVLYALAEAASGDSLARGLDLSADAWLPVLRSSKVKYRRPAEGALYAAAELPEAAVSQFQQQLAAKGRAVLAVPVSIEVEDGQSVFEGEFTWFLTRRETS